MKVLRALELDSIKTNKAYFSMRIIMSILVGISYFLDSILVFKEPDQKIFWDNTKNSDVYFTNPNLYSFILLICIAIIIFISISIIGYIIDKKKIFKTSQNKKNDRIIYLFIFISILIMWIPYFLSFFPGGYYGDVKDAILQAIGRDELTNHQPIVFTFIISVFFNISKTITNEYELGYITLGSAQFVLMIAFITYFIYWFYRKGIDKKIIIILTLFFGLFKLFPLYAVSIWKETPFSLFIILLCIQIADIILSKGKKLEKKPFTISIIINVLLICFLRNNGLYIVIPSFICIIWCYKKYKRFVYSIIATIICITIIQMPLYKFLKINSKFSESIGIPLQQIGYVIVNDGNINEEQMKYIKSIVSIEKVKKLYSPWNVDYIKFNSDLKIDNIENNKIQFFKLWIELFIQNPDMYIKEYILHLTGFWNINRAYSGDMKDYVNPITEYADRKDFNLYQIDIIKGLTGFSISKTLIDLKKQPISSAIFIFIILISVAYILKMKNYKMILVYLPILFLIATIFIATPIAFGLRYVYPVVIFAPFSIIFPFWTNNLNKSEK